ncbi:MAG: hypothetical protein JSW00_19840 [Thermoplasmata archaeon]|nr:MAG: hypothetical protein JSW00_19840 [Thermoplasmata archaeon]
MTSYIEPIKKHVILDNDGGLGLVIGIPNQGGISSGTALAIRFGIHNQQQLFLKGQQRALEDDQRREWPVSRELERW